MNLEQLKAFRKAKVIEQANKRKIVKYFGEIPDTAGIYILTREENGFKYCYVGQAKHILTRLAEHLKGYQHIDLSIKNHGLFSAENKAGWKLCLYDCCGLNELDEKEQNYIKIYANNGYQMRNNTAGGQGQGKYAIADGKPAKGYYDGLKQGYLNAQKEVANWFAKSLDFAIKGKPNKNKEKAFQRFENFLNFSKNNNKTIDK